MPPVLLSASRSIMALFGRKSKQSEPAPPSNRRLRYQPADGEGCAWVDGETGLRLGWVRTVMSSFDDRPDYLTADLAAFVASLKVECIEGIVWEGVATLEHGEFRNRPHVWVMAEGFRVDRVQRADAERLAPDDAPPHSVLCRVSLDRLPTAPQSALSPRVECLVPTDLDRWAEYIARSAQPPPPPVDYSTLPPPPEGS